MKAMEFLYGHVCHVMQLMLLVNAFYTNINESIRIFYNLIVLTSICADTQSKAYC